MSRTKVFTAIGVLVSIVFVVWIARNTRWVEETVPRPLRGEALTNPFYAAEHLAEWLGAEGERVHSVKDLPPEGVLVLVGWNWNLIRSRREVIERWVENGGRLVLDRDVTVSDREVQDWAGLWRVRVKPGGEPVETIDAAAAEDDEQGCGPMRVEHDVDGVSRGRTRYELCTVPALKAIATDREPLWAISDDEGFQAVRVRVGRGSVTWLNAQPFQYRNMMDADHALIFAAVTQLRRGDRVLFLADEDQPSLPVLIWRYGAPVVVLFLLWLTAVLWRNGVRFGPPAPSSVQPRRSLAEQIKGTSEFTRRFGGGKALHVAEVRALQELAANRIPGFRSMSRDEQLAALAALTNVDAEKLGETINYSGPRRPHELKKALELIEQVRRRLVSRESEESCRAFLRFTTHDSRLTAKKRG